MSLLSIFATAILPIVSLAGLGFLLGRVKDVDTGPLNTVVVYILAPALVFHSLATTTLGGDTLVRVVGGVAVYLVAMVVIGEAVGRLFGRSEPLLSALVLVSAFPNSGNYGIPVAEFAFGATGRSTAVLFLAAQSVLIYTVGVYIASRSGGKDGFAGVKRVLRIPLVYAVIAALAVRYLGVVPPAETTAMTTLKLVGDSSIPLMLLILGIQLARTNYGAALRRAGTANVLKMVVAPVVGLGVAFGLGFTDPTVAKVFVLECAMPAAVTPLILISEFASDQQIGNIAVAEYVSTVVLTTTLVSVPLLTLYIALLETGVLF
ncbi:MULTISPECIES: AEC family transporter [unclassified Haladaptatus]|uniref:AEC family transporter n=1 Tax=unclassified Haladaptatus TaxID=2622732 RepID=UPI0023E80249|nr:MULTISPECIES: AEC family transporter [unclassified Haladaptatus]